MTKEGHIVQVRPSSRGQQIAHHNGHVLWRISFHIDRFNELGELITSDFPEDEIFIIVGPDGFVKEICGDEATARERLKLCAPCPAAHAAAIRFRWTCVPRNDGTLIFSLEVFNFELQSDGTVKEVVTHKMFVGVFIDGTFIVLPASDLVAAHSVFDEQIKIAKGNPGRLRIR